MEIGVSASERKPVATVTVGSVAISIYASSVTVRPKPTSHFRSCITKATGGFSSGATRWKKRRCWPRKLPDDCSATVPALNTSRKKTDVFTYWRRSKVSRLAWHYLLNFWHRPDFSRTEALATLSQEAQRLGKKTFSRYSGSSFHHIPSYLRMRFPAARSRGVRRSLLCLHARPEKNWKTGVGKSVSWSSNLAEGLSRTTGRAILFRRFQSVLAVVTTSDSPVQKVGLCALPNLVFTCFGEPVWMKCSFKYHASRLLFGMIPCSHLRRLTLNGASSMACCTSN